RSVRPRAQVLRTGELVVADEDGGLRVRTRDRAHAFDVIAFFEQHLIAESFAHYSLLAPRPHTPRIRIDEVVVQRESWRLTREELAFAHEETPFQRMVAAQRLAQERRLPRRLFVKVPEELKPCFIDLDSPAFMELGARVLRRATAATFTE